MLHFLFPSDSFRASSIDEMFVDQCDAVQSRGYSSSLVPESFFRNSRPLNGIPSGATVIYRGWMLDAASYEKLHTAVAQQNASMLTSPPQYLAAHHLPNWYPLITELTPETRILDPQDDPESQLRAIGWPRYFVKDYVKSLKTGQGAIIDHPAQIKPLLAEMERIRGEIEGGVCVRRVEEFVQDSERRYFVVESTPHAGGGGDVPEIVTEVAKRVSLPFYSVDVVRHTDGRSRVVEIGDGQVSDIVGWNAAEFASIWKA